jgi:flagellar biosynthesis protein FlhF
MKIKRYSATSMRIALAQVRAEQGPDAVILSSRRSAEGIEVIAAVDYDESLILDAGRSRTPPPAAAHLAPQQPVPTTPAMARRVAAAGASPRSGVTVAPVPRPAVAGAAARASAAAPALAAAAAFASMPASARSTPVSAAPAPTAAQAARAALVAAAAKAQAARAALVAAAAAANPKAVSAGLVAAAANPRSVSTARVSAAAAPTKAVSTRFPAAAAPAGYGEMRRELSDLRHLLERQLADSAWRDKRLRDPAQARVFEALTALDIAPDVAQKLAGHTPKNLQARAAGNVPAALLAKYLPMTLDLDALNTGIIVVVGPTGAGKTTTIAKLAARWSLRHGSEDLALVSTDGYRIGAREQLATFARILGVPLHAANDGPELARVLGRLAGKKLVLVDTAGVGRRDARLSQQLEALRLGAGRARAVLALPAQCESQALDAIIKVFAPLTPVACVLTKIDEAASLGAALSTILRNRLPIAYLCNGQRVPEDMHAAHRRRIWLVQTAMMLKQPQPRTRDAAAPVRHSGGTHVHA